MKPQASLRVNTHVLLQDGKRGKEKRTVAMHILCLPLSKHVGVIFICFFKYSLITAI